MAAVLASSFTGLKAAVAAKPFGVSNGYTTSAMMVWTPNNNKFFETLSYLPPLSDADVAKQVQYITRNGWTPCLEFSAPEGAYTLGHDAGYSGIVSSAACGYYDNRYWSMWKLPMFGCSDPRQVLAETKACSRAFPGSFVRVAGFDNIKQVQCASFLVARPQGYEPIPTNQRSI
jgi:ribulose-bisphosphate carboxylase small chain